MSIWGPLAGRFEPPKPQRKLLALDGGGIRGIITLEILSALESQLAHRFGRGADFRLCEYFDYVGGTSTGAIIAAGIARGMSVAELLDIYMNHGAELFDKAFVLARLKNLYKSEPIAKIMREKFGVDTTLEPQYLRCLLLAITQNVTTDSPWPISSNPLAKYNDVSRADCNLKIPLWQLVRASTAAPVYFPPEVLQWDPANPDKAFVFVDGGMTPYNNPAFVLFRMATDPAYRLKWDKGEDKLLIVSVGTGTAPSAGPEVTDAHRNLVSNVTHMPGGLMYAMLVDQDINCRTIGRCTHGAPIDRELGDMVPRDGTGDEIPLSQGLGRAFLYARYNAELSLKGLTEMGLPDIEPGDVQKLDSVKHVDQLSSVGKAVAKRVSLAHLGPFV
jgi:patatin-like phospholipase/acyl hydrolase